MRGVQIADQEHGRRRVPLAVHAVGRSGVAPFRMAGVGVDDRDVVADRGGGTRSAGTGPAGVGASVGSAVGLGGRLLGPVVGEAPGVDVGGDAAGSGVARSTITSPVAAAVVPRTPKIAPVPSATTATRTLEMPAVASALDGLSRDARPWRMGSSINAGSPRRGRT